MNSGISLDSERDAPTGDRIIFSTTQIGDGQFIRKRINIGVDRH